MIAANILNVSDGLPVPDVLSELRPPYTIPSSYPAIILASLTGNERAVRAGEWAWVETGGHRSTDATLVWKSAAVPKRSDNVSRL